jgi:hypothetical protein
MNHTEIINAIVKKYGYTSYLEIGVQHGVNFRAIECEDKVGVDPDKNSKATNFLTSDLFFEMAIIKERKFDCIFIDGLHESDQVERDIVNALKCLKENGTIVVHDCNPSTEIMQRVPREVREWTGDGWKAWVKLRASGHCRFVVDTDYGVGIIRKEKIGEAIPFNEINWENFSNNKKAWLNLISIEDFREWVTQKIPAE